MPSHPTRIFSMCVSSLSWSLCGACRAASTVYRAQARALERGLQLEMLGDLARRLGWRKPRCIDGKARDEGNRREDVVRFQQRGQVFGAGKFVIRATRLVFHPLQQCFGRACYLDKADL